MELFKLFGTIAIQNADANEAIDDTTDKASQSENKISSAFKKIGTVVAGAFAVDKIKDFGLSCIDAASDANAATSQFSQVFGDMESQASKSLQTIADNTGIAENRMKGSYTQIAAFAKTTGLDTSSALSLADRAMVAVADSAAFYDRSLEETTESLQSFLKGNYENDAALGLSCTEITRNEAANRLYGKSFQDLSESQKQLTLLQMVEDANKLSGAMGQAARESDTWTNQTGNLQQSWENLKAVIGQNFLDIAVQSVKKLSEVIQDLAVKVPEVTQWFRDHEGVIKTVVTAVGMLTGGVLAYRAAMAISSIIQGVTTALNGMTVAQYALNTAMSLNPIGIVVGVIAALVVAIVAAYNHFEGFRNAVNSVGETIKANFTAALEAAQPYIDMFVSAVQNLVSAIGDKLQQAFAFLKPYIDGIVTAVGELSAAINERLTQALTWIVTKVTEVYNSSSPVIQAIKTVFTTAFQAIQTVISTVFSVIKTVISTALTVIKQIIQTATAVIKGDWQGAWNGIKSIFTTVWNGIKTVVTTILNAIKSLITTALNAIKSVVSSVLNAVKSVFSSVWNGIKSTVSNVINGVKSTISSGLNAAKNTVSNVLNSIKNKFSSIFESAKSIVSGAINKIKGFFNFSWSLPKIKLPHFSISGKFSLNPPSIPHFSVSWYKKAMDEPYMFTKPTLFDVNPATGKAKGAGEAGDEVMIGKDTMLNMIRQAVAAENSALAEKFDQLISLLNEFFPAILKAMERAIVLDDGTLVGRLTPAIDEELGKILGHKGRGN